MISRRSLLLTSSAAALSAALFARRATAQEAFDFICGTTDPEPTAEGLAEIEDFSSDAGVEIGEAIAQLGASGVIVDYGTFLLSRRWRKSDGLNGGEYPITLGVHFIDGTDQQKAAVRTHAVKWLDDDLGQKLDFLFDVEQADAQISVTFNTNKNSSIVGRESAKYAKESATMHLGQIHERTICHEFGHALGFSHEHQNPDIPIVWNEDVVIADMAEQGWTPSMVEHNIFNRYSADYACIGDPSPNRKSIMMYPIKETWTQNDFSTGLNNQIDERDRKCSIAVYSV